MRDYRLILVVPLALACTAQLAQADNTWSREFSVYNTSVVGEITDAFSREFSVYNTSVVGEITDAFSREFSVYNDYFDDEVTDAVSREFSVFNNNYIEPVSDAFSREFSVFNNDYLDVVNDALAREFSVYNSDYADLGGNAFSREFSVHLPPIVLDLEPSPPEGGTTIPDICTSDHEEGEIVEVLGVANGGYDFDHWEVGDFRSTVDDPNLACTTIELDDNTVLTAVFVVSPTITITWTGEGDGVSWSDPDNWCPAIVPDETGAEDYRAIIDGATSIVQLDISPTLTLLEVTNDAVLQVIAATGSQSITVTGGIINTGTLRANDGQAFVITADINQDPNGGIEVFNAALVQIIDGTVFHGFILTAGDGLVDLMGTATLDNVGVSGLVVPNGETVNLDGTAINVDTIFVDAVTLDTRIDALSALTLTPLTPGAAELILGDESLALLGDTGQTIVNDSGHAVRGAGVIRGLSFTNHGTIEAGPTGHGGTEPETLMLEAPTDSDGALRAADGFTLDIKANVSGTGTLEASGGTIRLSPNSSALLVAGTSMNVVEGSGGFAGTVDVLEDASVTLSGQAVVGPGGTYRADPDAGDPVSATLEAGSITIMESTLGGAPGSMILTDSMNVTSTGDLIMDGINAGSCEPGRSDTPPILRVLSTSQVFVGADLQLVHSAELLVGASGQMSVSGSFVNESVYPECFDCLDGTLLLSGAAPQDLEIAGEDRGADPAGFDENFAIGTVELQAGVTVDIIDVFDNQQDTHTGCDEVLYVDTLILNAGAVLSTDGCTVYYNNLQNSGGSIPGLGSEVLNIAGADVDDDGDVDLDDYSGFTDCFAGPGGNPDPTPPLTAQKCLDRFDADHDSDLDLADYGNFQSLFGGGA